MMGSGTPAGATTPNRGEMSTPGRPASVNVGTSGSWLARCGLVTASARRRPPLMCSSSVGTVAKANCTWPPSRSVMTVPPPRYGTCSTSTPACWRSCSPARCGPLPTPADPNDNVPGCALASATKAATSVALTDGCTTITNGAVAISEIGAKSLIAS
ncbi:hypothetical protein D3C72_1404840 [compost metagenome]